MDFRQPALENDSLRILICMSWSHKSLNCVQDQEKFPRGGEWSAIASFYASSSTQLTLRATQAEGLTHYRTTRHCSIPQELAENRWHSPTSCFTPLVQFKGDDRCPAASLLPD